MPGQPARIWRMEATDQEGEPITGPWESKAEAEAEAEKRKADVVDGHFIRKAKVICRKK